jgi:hypothetical protein
MDSVFIHYQFSSSKSNHIEVTLLLPSRACSSVMILNTTTSSMHNANSITNIAKLEPWWWNWKEVGSGPGGGKAATPNITRLGIPVYIVRHITTVG